MNEAATPPAPDEPHDAARERVQTPAMFLVANRPLNLLVALFVAGDAAKEAATPEEGLRDEWVRRLVRRERGGAERGGPLRQSLDQAGGEPGRFKRQRVAADASAGGVLLVGAVLGVL